MNENKNMHFLHWLTLIFITLKLTHHIDWQWFYVVSPLIIIVINNYYNRNEFV
jgi:hypothetical protein